MADKSITMKDVARETGVALGTVSKVVNGIPVGKNYQRRVEDAIDKLGYRINRQARVLRSNKSNIVEVILPNLYNPFFARLADCLCRELSRRSYQTLLFLTESSFELEQAYMLMSEQQLVSGIICLTYNPNLRMAVQRLHRFGDRLRAAPGRQGNDALPVADANARPGGILMSVRQCIRVDPHEHSGLCGAREAELPGRLGDEALFPTVVKLSVSYAESDGATWITIDCGGAAFNPFEQENDGLGVTILKRMARHLDYRVEGGRNVVNIVL